MSEANERAYEKAKALDELARANVFPGITDVAAETQACSNAVSDGPSVPMQVGEYLMTPPDHWGDPL